MHQGEREDDKNKALCQGGTGAAVGTVHVWITASDGGRAGREGWELGAVGLRRKVNLEDPRCTDVAAINGGAEEE